MRCSTAVYLILLLLFTAGCDQLQEPEQRTEIAKVKEHLLYMDELKSALPSNMSPDDSLRFANNFINTWATQMLLLDKAELNLTTEEKNVAKQLEEYRRSLIIYQYEKQLVGQLLDTSVTDRQIQTYYDNNQDNFELQDNIARALFVKLEKKSKDVNKITKLVRSVKEEDRAALQEYCVQHAMMFHLNEEQWVPFHELLGLLPKTSYLNLNYFSLYNFAHLQDSTAHYLFEVKEIKYKNSVSPIEFQKDNIRNILLNQRKLEIIQKLEKDILEEAVSKNNFEILYK